MRHICRQRFQLELSPSADPMEARCCSCVSLCLLHLYLPLKDLYFIFLIVCSQTNKCVCFFLIVSIDCVHSLCIGIDQNAPFFVCTQCLFNPSSITNLLLLCFGKKNRTQHPGPAAPSGCVSHLLPAFASAEHFATALRSSPTPILPSRPPPPGFLSCGPSLPL